MNKKAHQIAGVAASELSLAMHHDFLILHWKYIPVACFGAYIIGKIISIIPDLIEPAKWNHRKFFHSWFVLICCISLLVASYMKTPTFHGYYMIADITLTAMAAGYASHLLLDAVTPAGLPII